MRDLNTYEMRFLIQTSNTIQTQTQTQAAEEDRQASQEEIESLTNQLADRLVESP